jgi:hypothetical protein
VTACREANSTHPEFNAEDKLWDAPLDLSALTLTVIKAYSEGSAENKDQEKDGFALGLPSFGDDQGSRFGDRQLQPQQLHRLPVLRGGLPIRRAALRI